MSDQADQKQIKTELAKIRRKRRGLTIIVVSYVPAVALFYFLRLPDWLILGSAVAIICLGIVISFVIGLAPCPACCSRFHVRGMGGSIFTGKCMHCGIPLLQTSGER